MAYGSTIRIGVVATLATLLASSACEDAGEGGSGGGTLTSASSTTGGIGGAVSGPTSTTATSTGTGPYDITCEETYTDVDETDCSLLIQDCGPYATCDIAASASTCRTSLGLKDAAMACTSDGECKPGLVCVLGRCVNHCCPSNNEPCGNGVCQQVNVGNQFAHFCTYLTICDLFDPTSCPDGEGCFIDINPDSDLTICVQYSGTPAGEGESCSSVNDCTTGMECNGSICRFYCDPDTWEMSEPGMGGCPAGQMCFNGLVGTDPIGTCRPM